VKILFVLEYFYPNIGGVETLFKLLTERLAQQGHQVTVLTTKVSRDSPFKEVYDNLIIYRFPFYNRFIFTFLGIFPALYLSFKSDFIHTTTYNAGFPAFFAGLISRRKVVITFNEIWGDLWFELPYLSKPPKRIYFYYEKLLLKLPFYKYIAVSNFTKLSLQNSGISSKKIEQIYCGIDYTDFEPKTDAYKNNSKFTFCYFGRLGISKGLDLLLEATNELVSRNIKFKLNLIIPKKPRSFYNSIQEIISEYGIDNVIEQYHNLSFMELKDKIKGSDAVIVPSHSEGFGFSAVESVALGMPIVTSGKGSLSEVVSGKFIAMKEHSSKGLSDAMQQALDGHWDHSTIKKFELEDSVQKLVNLYESL